MDCIAEAMQQKVDLFHRLPQSIRREVVFVTTTKRVEYHGHGTEEWHGESVGGNVFLESAPPDANRGGRAWRGYSRSHSGPVTGVVERIGKIPVRVNRDVPGFIENRLLYTLWQEAINLVQRGIVSPEDIGRVSHLTFGLRLPGRGPLENMDLVSI